jgi:hypothetical protein
MTIGDLKRIISEIPDEIIVYVNYGEVLDYKYVLSDPEHGDGYFNIEED